MCAGRVEECADGRKALAVGREDGAYGDRWWCIFFEQKDKTASGDGLVDLIVDELSDPATIESGVQNRFH